MTTFIDSEYAIGCVHGKDNQCIVAIKYLLLEVHLYQLVLGNAI